MRRGLGLISLRFGFTLFFSEWAGLSVYLRFRAFQSQSQSQSQILIEMFIYFTARSRSWSRVENFHLNGQRVKE